MTFPSKRAHKIDKAIIKLDRLIETLHENFDPHDREVEPALQLLSKARMSLENLKLTIERSGER